MKPEVVALLERIYAQLPVVECKRLCGGYCGPIVASPTERARMEGAGFPRVFAASVTTVRCNYYDETHAACRIHPVRPLICRLFGSAPHWRLQCPHGCRVIGSVSNEQVQRWVDEIQALDGSFEPMPLV